MWRARPSRIIPHGVWLRAEGVRAGGLRPGTVSDGGMGIAYFKKAARHTTCAHVTRFRGFTRTPLASTASIWATMAPSPSGGHDEIGRAHV